MAFMLLIENKKTMEDKEATTLKEESRKNRKTK